MFGPKKWAWVPRLPSNPEPPLLGPSMGLMTIYYHPYHNPLKQAPAWRVIWRGMCASAYDELSHAQIGFLLGKASHWAENLFGPNCEYFGPQQRADPLLRDSYRNQFLIWFEDFLEAIEITPDFLWVC
ncbi:unnamed protein product [Prunus armeniaca]